MRIVKVRARKLKEMFIFKESKINTTLNFQLLPA